MGRKRFTKLDWAYKDWQDARRRAHYNDDDPEVTYALERLQLERRKRYGHTGDFYKGTGFRRRRRKAQAMVWGHLDISDRREVTGTLTRFGFTGGYETRKADHFHDAYLVKGWLCQMKRIELEEQGDWVTSFIVIEDATIMNRYDVDGCDAVRGHVKGGFLDRIEVDRDGATEVVTDDGTGRIVDVARALGLFPTDEELDAEWAA